MKSRKKYISPRVDVFRMDTNLNVQLSSKPNHGDDNWDAFGMSSFSRSPQRKPNTSSFSGNSINDDSSFAPRTLTGPY